MMSFSSSFHAEPEGGVACFASVNARMGSYRPRLTTAYAIRLMRAAKSGQPLPSAPDPLSPWRIADARPFVGRFQAGAAGAFAIEVGPGGPRIASDGAQGRLASAGPDRLSTDHPILSQNGLDVVREHGEVTGFWWGGALYRREGDVRPPPTRADSLRPYAGVYLNRDPWVGAAILHVRGDGLVLEGQGRLVDRGGWWSVEKDPGGVERLRFDGLLNGKAQRLNLSGADLLRLEV
jgi:hypothetical protein